MFVIDKTITVSVALPGDKDLSEEPKNEPKAIKPKISWSKLIAEALQNSPNEMLPLPEIYKAISAKHPYYKIGDSSFKSSIRSELTREKNMDMEKGFWKVKGDKGWCWTFSKDSKFKVGKVISVPENVSSIDIPQGDIAEENSQIEMEDPYDFVALESVKYERITGKIFCLFEIVICIE